MRRRGCANRDLWGEDAIEAGVGGSGPDIAKGGGPTPLKKNGESCRRGGPPFWEKMARAAAERPTPLDLEKNGESYRRSRRGGLPPWTWKKWRELPQEG